MKKQNNLLKYITLFPPIIIMVAIFCFSAQPAEESSELSGGFAERVIHMVEHITGKTLTEEKRIELCEQLQFPVRKGAHMTEYAVLGITILIPLLLWKENWDHKRLITVSILLTTGYAATDEIHQLFVPGRAGRLEDVLIDGTGAVIGIILADFVLQRILRRENAASS